MQVSTKYTISRLSRKAAAGKKDNEGSGWSTEGIDRYNDLYLMVIKDRTLRGATFNQELLLFYKEQCQKRDGMRKKKSSKKRKSVAFDDFNPPEHSQEV